MVSKFAKYFPNNAEQGKDRSRTSALLVKLASLSLVEFVE